MKELFKIIRTQKYWEPLESINYSKIDIQKLREMADEWFDKLNTQGYFFHDYNVVMERIEELKKIKLKK